METFTLGVAIEQLRAGKSVARQGWNANHKLMMQVTDANSKMTQNYVYMTTAQGALVPWVCSQTDLLATDWFVTE
jgi:Protein of unknown function (DUF2829)